MTGVYTDNQPDFTWLQPYEEKSFKQYFMPYKDIGVVKNASIEAAVNLEVDEKARTATVLAYATSDYEGAVVELKGARRTYVSDTVRLSPVATYKTVVSLDEGDQPHDLLVTVCDREGRLLISYRPAKPSIELAARHRQAGAAAPADYCFPNSLAKMNVNKRQPSKLLHLVG